MEHHDLLEVYKMAWGLLLPFAVWLVLRIFTLEKTLAVLQTEAISREQHRIEMLDLISKNHDAALENTKAMRAQLTEHSRQVSERLNSIDAHLRNGAPRT